MSKKNQPIPPMPEYGSEEYATWYRDHVAPGHASKKSHKIRNAVIGLVGLAVLGGIIGSAAGGSSDKGAPPKASDSATTAPAHKAAADDPASKKPAAPAKSAPPAVDMGDPVNEMTVVAGTCKFSSLTHWPSARVEITNPTADPSTFTATVVFESLDGSTQYDTAVVFADHVGHGVTTTVDAQGLGEIPANVHAMRCRLTSQDRTAS